MAELVGTFTLIFAGVGAVLSTQGTNLVAVALAHGIAIAVMGSALGHVSGGAFNPAVTLALWVTRRLPAIDAVSYIVVQLLGGIAAAFVLSSVFPPLWQDQVQLGATLLAPGVSPVQGIIIETVLTFFLVTAIFGTALDSRGPKLGALLIGLTIAMDIAAAGPMTGASMNPARSLGPALVGGEWKNHAVYWIGPILGAVIAALVYDFAFAEKHVSRRHAIEPDRADRDTLLADKLLADNRRQS
ncbi:MAG: aquaporin [Dehalococcoidia bacterium]|nr:aquaporin [Dehalococcoidia bacterium]